MNQYTCLCMQSHSCCHPLLPCQVKWAFNGRVYKPSFPSISLFWPELWSHLDSVWQPSTLVSLQSLLVAMGDACPTTTAATIMMTAGTIAMKWAVCSDLVTQTQSLLVTTDAVLQRTMFAMVSTTATTMAPLMNETAVSILSVPHRGKYWKLFLH